ncbi:hypothetical protein FRA_44c11730 [Francisella sp. W12-1067]|nr:hypothetical protein FRA_44c11730 [Francisella sp. W12-1067]
MELNIMKDYFKGKWRFKSQGIEELQINISASQLGSQKNMDVCFTAIRTKKNEITCHVGTSKDANYDFNTAAFINEEQQSQNDRKSVILINGGFFDSPAINNDGLPNYGENQPIGYTKSNAPHINFVNPSPTYCHNVNKKYTNYYGLITASNNGYDIFEYKSILDPDNFLSQFDSYLTSAPILIKDDNIVFTQATMNLPIFRWDDPSRKNAPGFLHHADQPNPRSCFGFNDHYYFFVTILGRAGQIKGLNLAECAILMKALGSSQAINLDGGGSSQLLYANRVSSLETNFGGNRKVADVLFVKRKHNDPWLQNLANTEGQISLIQRRFRNYRKNMEVMRQVYFLIKNTKDATSNAYSFIGRSDRKNIAFQKIIDFCNTKLEKGVDIGIPGLIYILKLTIAIALIPRGETNNISIISKKTSLKQTKSAKYILDSFNKNTFPEIKKMIGPNTINEYNDLLEFSDLKAIFKNIKGNTAINNDFHDLYKEQVKIYLYNKTNTLANAYP